MWLPLDGAPPPNGAGAGAGSGGGAFARKDAAVSRAVATARVTHKDRATAKKVQASKVLLG